MHPPNPPMEAPPGRAGLRRQTPSSPWLAAPALAAPALAAALLAAAPAAADPLPSGPLTRYPQNPLLDMGPPGAVDSDKTGPRVVLLEGTKYRMWYEAVPGGNKASVGYAESPDGLTWTKMGVVLSPSAAWEGGPDGEVSPNSIFIEDGVYHLFYHGYQGGVRRIGHATSSDGLAWTKSPDPVLDVGPSGAFDDRMVVEPRVFKVGDEYRMYYGGLDYAGGLYRLALATSPDLVTWTKWPGNPLSEGTIPPHEGAGHAIVFDGGVWHMWWSLITYSSPATDIRYASSADGLSFTPGPVNPVLTGNPVPTAPDVGVGDSVAVVRDAGEYRVMYTGSNIGNYPNATNRIEAVCLATIAVPPPDGKPSIRVEAGAPVTEGERGAFTLRRTRTSAYPELVTFLVSGTAESGSDYKPIGGYAVIPQNADNVTIHVDTYPDDEAEDAETVIVSLGPGNAYDVDPTGDSATLEILDGPITTGSGGAGGSGAGGGAAAGGSGAAGPGDTSGDDGGCGCRAAGAAPVGQAGGFIALAAALAARRRRARRTRSA